MSKGVKRGSFESVFSVDLEIQQSQKAEVEMCDDDVETS
jgi:hypothetical protein